MGWRFNPAPGWPPAPPGFLPPTGWAPDPSWPVAPPGWSFIVDEVTGKPAPTAVEGARGRIELAGSRVTRGPEPVIGPPRASKAGWSERRAGKRAAREYGRAQSLWQSEQDQLDALTAAARWASQGGGGVTAGIVLKGGEALVWTGDGSLVEPRRQAGQYVGRRSGVSFRVAPGVRYSAGGFRGRYVPGPEVQAPVDSGHVAITTQRVVFAGGKATREWSYAKLVGIDAADNDHAVLIHVTHREKVSGLILDKAGPSFIRFLTLAIAIDQHGARVVAAECERAAAAHRRQRPVFA